MPTRMALACTLLLNVSLAAGQSGASGPAPAAGTATRAPIANCAPEDGTGGKTQMDLVGFSDVGSELTPPHAMMFDQSNLGDPDLAGDKFLAVENRFFAILDSGQPLTFSAIGVPASAVWTPATGNFQWTPSETEGPGVYTVIACSAIRIPFNATSCTILQ